MSPRYSLALAVVAAALALLPAGSGASAPTRDQIGFSREVRADSIVYDVTWRDRRRAVHRIRFSLPRAAVDEGRAAVRRLDGATIARKVEPQAAALRERKIEALRQRYPEASISFDAKRRLYIVSTEVKPAAGTVEAAIRRVQLETKAEIEAALPRLTVTLDEKGGVAAEGPMSPADRATLDRLFKRMQSRGAAAQAELDRSLKRQAEAVQAKVAAELDVINRDIQGEMRAATDDAVAELGYVRDGNDRAQVDFRRHAQAATAHFAEARAPFAALIADEGDRRAQIERMLSFFQTIPYDELTDRRRSDGAGFAVPAVLIDGNRGDCDTKSVAFAALMQVVAPDIPVVMVLLRSHALLGLGIPASAADRTIVHEGRRYVLVEPVGPALAAVGEIGPLTRRELGGRKQVLTLF